MNDSNKFLKIRQYSFDEIKELLTERTTRIKLDGLMVHINKTFRTFLKKGNTCVHCKRKGTLVIPTKDNIEKRKKGERAYHLKLYHIAKNGNLILMTKDHIIPASVSHNHTYSNLQTMCTECNAQKGDGEEVDPSINVNNLTKRMQLKNRKYKPLTIRAETFWSKLSLGAITHKKFMALIKEGYFEGGSTIPPVKQSPKKSLSEEKQLEIINIILSKTFGVLQSTSPMFLKNFLIFENGHLKGFTLRQFKTEILIDYKTNSFRVKCLDQKKEPIEYEILYKDLSITNKGNLFAIRAHAKRVLRKIKMKEEFGDLEDGYLPRRGTIHGMGKFLRHLEKELEAV